MTTSSRNHGRFLDLSIASVLFIRRSPLPFVACSRVQRRRRRRPGRRAGGRQGCPRPPLLPLSYRGRPRPLREQQQAEHSSVIRKSRGARKEGRKAASIVAVAADKLRPWRRRSTQQIPHSRSTLVLHMLISDSGRIVWDQLGRRLHPSTEPAAAVLVLGRLLV